MVTYKSWWRTLMSCLRSKQTLRWDKINSACLHLSPGLSAPNQHSKQPITAVSLGVEYQLNITRILAMMLSIFCWFCAISATIWSGVNSPGFNWRYSAQVLHLLGGSEDPGWTLTFLIKPLGQVVAPPLCNN